MENKEAQCECFSPKPHHLIDPRIALGGMDGMNPVDSFLLSSAVMNLPFYQPVDINDDQTTSDIGSNCSLSVNEIVDTIEIIDTVELPIISVQQLEEHLPTDESSSSNEPKIKILEERRFFPKSKKILTEFHRNSVDINVPSTQRCKFKIQTIKGVQCQKCFTTISGQKGTCIGCKKIYCSECIGQQMYPDFICDPCLES